MKAKIKMILYYFLEFILSLTIFLLISLIILKTTLYNPNYIQKEFNKNNYYSNLYNSINEEMSNYIIQSGLEEDVLKDIYTEEMLKENINDIINTSYNNKKIIIDTKKVEESLKNNINKYLSKNNIEITDEESLNKFIEQIITVYKNEISLSNKVELAQKVINKTQNIITISIIVLIIISISIILIIKKISKENILGIPLITSGLLLLFIYIFVTGNIEITSLFIWDNNVSQLLQSIITNILLRITISGILLIIIGLITSLNFKKIKLFFDKVKK